MSLVLQITLSVSVAVLTVFLVLLLVQARRTAAAMERLAESAARDLRQVAEEVHEVRVRVDEVADLVRSTFELPSALTQVVTGVVRAMPAFFARRSGSSNIVEALLTGVQTALHLFRTHPSKEEAHE